MHPISVQLLNDVEKSKRSRRVKALQLLNQAQATRPRRPHPLKELWDRLRVLLMAASQRLNMWKASPDRKVQGNTG
jgi:hypothetical protein